MPVILMPWCVAVCWSSVMWKMRMTSIFPPSWSAIWSITRCISYLSAKGWTVQRCLNCSTSGLKIWMMMPSRPMPFVKSCNSSLRTIRKWALWSIWRNIIWTMMMRWWWPSLPIGWWIATMMISAFAISRTCMTAEQTLPMRRVNWEVESTSYRPRNWLSISVWTGWRMWPNTNWRMLPSVSCWQRWRSMPLRRNWPTCWMPANWLRSSCFSPRIFSDR